ncbi:MAG: UMP kinase [Candidatus Doudnabacteria bacterium]|nr:UMP kinase [Candidatus Doudnabacteria bacterium]
MKHKLRKPIIISLGGSLIFPEEIDLDFLNNFKNLLVSQIKKGNRFILITGGGKICRKYQGALQISSSVNHQDLDWMGIYVTKTNANFIRLLFKDYSHKKIVDNPEEKYNFREKILLAGGWKPGCSTDKDAVLIAKTYEAETVINLSNIDYLYNKDPKKHSDAKKILKSSWDELLKITGSKWKPGANFPFDPSAAKLAKELGLKVIIANGKNLKNLSNILDGKTFEGTVVG